MNFELFAFAIVTLFGSAGFAAIIVKLLERQKTQAESTKITADAVVSGAQATDILTNAGNGVVEMLSAQLREAVARITVLEQSNIAKDRRILEMEREINDLRIHVAKLESEV